MLNRVHAVGTHNGARILVHGKFRTLRDDNALSLLNRRCILNLGNVLYVAHVYCLVAFGGRAGDPVVGVSEILARSTTDLCQIFRVSRDAICCGNKFFRSFWLRFRKCTIPRIALMLHYVAVSTGETRLTFNLFYRFSFCTCGR